MNIHIALYKWKREVKQEDIQRVLSDIESLATKISGIIEIVTSKNMSKYNDGYTHVIFVRSKSQSAIEAYKSHPDHVAAAQALDSMEEHGIGIDFETK